MGHEIEEHTPLQKFSEIRIILYIQHYLETFRNVSERSPEQRAAILVQGLRFSCRNLVERTAAERVGSG
jgi:hypothetical protein